jgi:hypothetical protein
MGPSAANEIPCNALIHIVGEVVGKTAEPDAILQTGQRLKRA